MKTVNSIYIYIYILLIVFTDNRYRHKFNLETSTYISYNYHESYEQIYSRMLIIQIRDKGGSDNRKFWITGLNPRKNTIVSLL
jgi:hypothetical protein